MLIVFNQQLSEHEIRSLRRVNRRNFAKYFGVAILLALASLFGITPFIYTLGIILATSFLFFAILLIALPTGIGSRELKSEYQVKLTENGVQFESTLHREFKAWALYQKYEQTSEFVFLRDREFKSRAISKRCIGDDLAQLMAFLKDRFDQK